MTYEKGGETVRKITKIEANKDSPYYVSKLRVAAYCRVSTNSDEQLESLEAQKSHYEKYIKTNQDWEYVGIYYDEGISGTKKDKRLGLLQMLSDCENNKIDLIVTKSISRFARNTTDCLEMVRKLIELGVFIYFEKENINTKSMESELMLSILSSLAESESASISENNKWSIQKRFENGTFKISYPPYGYKSVNGDLSIMPEQAEVVKYIFKEALSGKGTQKIADALNEKGIPTKRGAIWRSTTVRGILKNEKYTGDVILQKTYTDSNFNRHINKGEKNKYLIQNHHEAIISHEDFEAVEKSINQRAKEKGVERNSEKYQNRYAFSSKLICSECGDVYKRRIHSTGKRKYVAWCCSTHIEDISKCSMKFIRDEDIKSAFVTMINKLIYGKDFILKPLLANIRTMTKSENIAKLDEIEMEIEDNISQEELLVKLMAKGYLEPALYNREKNELLMARAEMTSKKEGLVDSLNNEMSKGHEVNKLIKYVNKKEYLTEFEEKTFEDFVEKVEVYSREEIGFVLKSGLTLRERM